MEVTPESEQGVSQAIVRGLIDFKSEPWPSFSKAAKSLVRQMLEPNPRVRLTANQVLDPRFGLACLGKVNMAYESNQDLMIRLYEFIANEEMACEEAELGPEKFAEKTEMQKRLQEEQLEMLKHMRNFNADDQSQILEKKGNSEQADEGISVAGVPVYYTNSSNFDNGNAIRNSSTVRENDQEPSTSLHEESDSKQVPSERKNNSVITSITSDSSARDDNNLENHVENKETSGIVKEEVDIKQVPHIENTSKQGTLAPLYIYFIASTNTTQTLFFSLVHM